MALSSCSSNWVLPVPLPIQPSSQIPSFDSFETQFDSEWLLLEAEQQLQQQEAELLLLQQAEQQQLSFYHGGGECEFEDNLSNSFIDPYFNPNEFFYSDESDFILNFNCDDNIPSSPTSLSPQHNHPYPIQHLDPYPLQKRQKVADDDQFPDSFIDYSRNRYAPWNGGTGNVWLPEQIQPRDQVFKYEGNLWLPEQNHVAPAAAAVGIQYGNVERKSVSPQSAAARERRRKIAEKTSELGKLIPGGTKMNTAEMFQSAYKYIKYLQASASLLQTMHKIQENHVETSNMETLQELLQSATVQEKLSAEEKCLVPIHFVKVLAERHESELGLSVGHDLNQLVGSENI